MVQVGLKLCIAWLVLACTQGIYGQRDIPETVIPASKTGNTPSAADTTAAGSVYRFSYSWHWQYKNTWIQDGDFGHAGEMVVYHDRGTGAWLLTAEAFGITDEMTDWILALPTGEYITAYRDGEGHAGLLRDTVHFSAVHLSFSQQFRPTGEQRLFGENSYGWPALLGHTFEGGYLKTGEQTTIWLADTSVNMTPLVHFNRRDADAKLPIYFTDGIPAGKVEVGSCTQSVGQQLSHRLTAIADNYYEINLRDYEQ